MIRSSSFALALLVLAPLSAAQVEVLDFVGLSVLDARVKHEAQSEHGPFLGVDLDNVPVGGDSNLEVVWQVPAPGTVVEEATPITVFASKPDPNVSAAKRPILPVSDLTVAPAFTITRLNKHRLQVSESGDPGSFGMPTFKHLIDYSVVKHAPGHEASKLREVGLNVDVIIEEGGITGAGGVTIKQLLLAALLTLLAGFLGGYFFGRAKSV